MNSNQNNKIIFSVTTCDLQNEAVNLIGRELNEDELYTAKKGIEAGLSFNIDTVLKTAVHEAVLES